MRKHKRIIFALIFVMAFVLMFGLIGFSVEAAPRRKITVQFKSLSHPTLYEKLAEEDKASYYENIGATFKGAESVYVNGNSTAVVPEAGKAYLPNEKTNWGISFTAVIPDAEGELEVLPYQGLSATGNEVELPAEADELNKAKLTTNPIKIPFPATVDLNETYLVVEGSMGGTWTTESTDIFKVDAEKVNVVLFLLDPSGTYVDGVGTHNWNGLEPAPAEWGSPVPFKFVGKAKGINMIGGHYTFAVDASPGGLIYATGDDDKHTGDFPSSVFVKEDGSKYAAGEFFAVFTHFNGLPYTSSDNIFPEWKVDEFIDIALTFKFKPAIYSKLSGTFAYSVTADAVLKTVIQAETTIAYSLTEEELGKTDAEVNALIKKNVKLVEAKLVGEGESAKLEADLEKLIDFNLVCSKTEKISKFILTLDSQLDNTKDYILIWDSSTDAIENRRAQAQIQLDMDKKAPTITFVSPLLNMMTEPVVDIKLGSEFLGTDIPAFKVDDDRDGTITSRIYVPGADENNELRFVNTGKEGDYKVLFRVTDDWGNVAEKIVTFRVKKEK